MTKHRYTATFKRKDETNFTKTFLASDLFEADELRLGIMLLSVDILYLDLGSCSLVRKLSYVFYIDWPFLKGLKRF